MITWLLIVQVSFSGFVTVPGILSERECQKLAQQTKDATQSSYGVRCISYYKTP